MLVRGSKIEGILIKYKVVQEAFARFGIYVVTNDSEAKVVWYDGKIPHQVFLKVLPHQRINKIPGLDVICFKNNTFAALNSARASFPEVFRFFPLTFLLPYQYSEFQKEHIRESSKQKSNITWIVKPRNSCCGNGIRLIQNSFEVCDERAACVVQSYVQPYLVDGYKFDFRFYLCISTLEPYTVFMYHEGIARFCTKKYAEPTRQTLDDRFAHLTNTAINVTNSQVYDLDYTKLASDVLRRIITIDERANGIWERIKNAAMLTMVAIYPSIISSIVSNDLRSRPNLCFKRFRKSTVQNSCDQQSLPPPKKFFHLIGIDILIREDLEPIVLELNDRPSLQVTFDLEAKLKPNIIFDLLTLITKDGSPPDMSQVSENWELLLPIRESHEHYSAVSSILNRSKKDFSVKKDIITRKIATPHVTTDPQKNKIMKKENLRLPPLRPSCQ